VTLWQWAPGARAWTPTLLPADGQHTLGPSVTLTPVGGGRYGVLASAQIRVNGEPILRLRVLDDRDELAFPDGTLYCVSVDDTPEIVPFSGSRPIRCARCGTSIEPGTLACTCPSCRVTCHETAELACWTHSDMCPACSHVTHGRSWQPDPLAMPPADGEKGAGDV
jgi:hypothetical protein